jgi:hypothetical protein
VYLAELRAALTSIHTRWEHGHDGITPGCGLCADEHAEVRALTAVAHALNRPHATT